MARSTCPSQNAENTPAPDHFWKLRCRKSVRRCGAKHMSKSKVEKTEGFGALLDVRISLYVACTRDSAPSQKWKKLRVVAVSSTTTTLHYITLHYATLHYSYNYNYNYTPTTSTTTTTTTTATTTTTTLRYATLH